MQERQDPAERRLEGKMTLLFSVASILFRLIHARSLANITPVGALGLFGGSRLRSWYAFIVPVSVMVISDVLLYEIFGDKPFNPFVYTCFALNVLWGWLFLKKVSPVRVGGLSLLSAVQFFLISNFGVWLGSHGLAGEYATNFGGLMLCYTEGLPFFRRTLIGDLGFSALFFGVYVWVTSLQSAAAKETA